MLDKVVNVCVILSCAAFIYVVAQYLKQVRLNLLTERETIEARLKVQGPLSGPVAGNIEELEEDENGTIILAEGTPVIILVARSEHQEGGEYEGRVCLCVPKSGGLLLLTYDEFKQEYPDLKALGVHTCSRSLNFFASMGGGEVSRFWARQDKGAEMPFPIDMPVERGEAYRGGDDLSGEQTPEPDGEQGGGTQEGDRKQ